ncbi:CACTA en-spm transposon protein [Cucumis melo var. makuwa]|uniref:CACTA en-spm transposon protein n=1 Tax=Cucumis melo var. makuwa TaxID=1194695 RepID=A0A5D3D4U3_CUCMM|nr:CACTA en-spm transposon protein [Cucumis melo var. makuwa]TYK18562.1 CACTA en-spm transposon protein [Cucumis melo var. makuwa]
MNKATKQKQPYIHSSGSKSFLQRQHELVSKEGSQSTCGVILANKRSRRDIRVPGCGGCTFSKIVATLNARTPVPAYPRGSQPLSEDEICETMLGRRPGYSKGFG